MPGHRVQRFDQAGKAFRRARIEQAGALLYRYPNGVRLDGAKASRWGLQRQWVQAHRRCGGVVSAQREPRGLPGGQSTREYPHGGMTELAQEPPGTCCKERIAAIHDDHGLLLRYPKSGETLGGYRALREWVASFRGAAWPAQIVVEVEVMGARDVSQGKGSRAGSRVAQIEARIQDAPRRGAPQQVGGKFARGDPRGGECVQWQPRQGRKTRVSPASVTLGPCNDDGIAVLAPLKVLLTIMTLAPSTIHVKFSGKLVCVGFGSIGQGVLPLILRHIGGLTADRITIVTAEASGAAEAERYGVAFVREPLTRDNYRQVLVPLLARGDFLLNLSVDVSSLALVRLCGELGVLYLDTCIEPWAGGYTDPALSHAQRTNYALREQALALRAERPGGPTAVLTHGANPGLVSHFVKQALLNIAADTGVATGVPTTREGWAQLACQLGIKVMHIAERDTQTPTVPKRMGEFVNTWSVDGFVGEGAQPAELGWGTHEHRLPANGREHAAGSGAAIYLMQPGAATKVRTWTPRAGYFHGFLITHSEAISLADFYTVREAGQVVYRPTAHYAYHPSDSAVISVHEFAGRNWQVQPAKRILMDEIAEGIDELGVLLAGHAKNAYWFGSQLSIHEARQLAPYNNATSLQVTVAVLSGLVWAMENPARGLVEPDEMDFRRCLEICLPYLGPVVGEYTDWTPLHDRARLFPEDLDPTCPWQFQNVLV